MANVYIDAGYVVNAAGHHQLDYRRINLEALGRGAAILFAWECHRTYIYDGVGDGEQPQPRQERQAWLERNDREDSCHYRRGRIASARREQKRVDVQLAVDVLRDIRNLRDPVDVVLVTGDDDFTPLVEAVREFGPQVGLVLFPRYGGTDDLRRAADSVREFEFSSGIWQAANRNEPFI